MKTLFLLRHAKSSWDHKELRDFERPLAERGLGDIHRIGQRFLHSGRTVGCIITSPAVRAKSTALLFAREIGYPEDDVTTNPELYFAGAPMFMKAASLVDEHFSSAMLVGHNPAITEFVNDLSDAGIDNIPTSGLVELALPIDHWSQIKYGRARLVDFDYPKRED